MLDMLQVTVTPRPFMSCLAEWA